MSTVGVTQMIAAPADALWRTFVDLPARARYLSTVDEVDVLTPGPFGAGTRWREGRTPANGLRVTEEFVVAEADPPVRCTLISPGIGADYRLTFRFTPVEVGRRTGWTTVTAVQEGGPTAAYGRLLALVFGGLAARAVEGALRQDLNDLAAAVSTGGGGTETGPGAGGPSAGGPAGADRVPSVTDGDPATAA